MISALLDKCRDLAFCKNEKALRGAPFQNPELWVLMGASPDEHSTGFELGLI
jgi:hypothetical protein